MVTVPFCFTSIDKNMRGANTGVIFTYVNQLQKTSLFGFKNYKAFQNFILKNKTQLVAATLVRYRRPSTYRLVCSIPVQLRGLNWVGVQQSRRVSVARFV